MASFLTIDDVSRDDVEFKARGHLQTHFKFDNLRFIFGRHDIQFDEPFVGVFAGALADAKMSGLASRWADAADLHPSAIKAAMFGTRASEPIRPERLLQPAREDQSSQRSVDPESIEIGLLLPATVV